MLYDFSYVKIRNKQKQPRITEISIVVASGRSKGTDQLQGGPGELSVAMQVLHMLIWLVDA